MGIIKLSGLTVGALAFALIVLGREEGLPDDRIGREVHRQAAQAEPVVVASADIATDTTPEPALTPILAVATDTSARIAPVVAETPTPEPIAVTAPVATVPLLYVTGSKVNMRAGPTTGNGIVASLRRGTAVDDMGPAGDGWTQIRVVATGERGFMATRFLAPTQP